MAPEGNPTKGGKIVNKLPQDSKASGKVDDDDDFSAQESTRDESKLGSASLAKRETNQIKKLRYLLLLVLLFAVGCSIGVFFYVKNSEVHTFEVQYQEDVTKVFASLGNTLDFSLAGLDALVVSIMSYARTSGSTWPYVTVPDFDVRAGKLLGVTKAFIINTYIYVEHEDRKAWENYTAHNSGWVQEGVDIQANYSGYMGPVVQDFELWDVIHGWDEYDKEEPGVYGTDLPGPYLPWWQCVPVIPYDPPYNWNLLDYEQEDVLSIFDTHMVTLSYPYMIAYENDTVLIEENEAEAEWVQDYIAPDEEPMEPIADLYYPLIEGATEKFSLFDGGNYDPKSNKLVGLLAMSFYWRSMIKNILPPGSDGIVLVFENDCAPTFTYMIRGPEVDYLGVGDHHEAEFDHLEKSSALLDLGNFALLGSGYSGIPVNPDICAYFVRAYPSSVMENDYLSSDPIIFSVSAGLIFLAFAATFTLYDVWVTRRQRIVMHRAQKSTAIVTSMFPEDMARRLIEDDDGPATNFVSRKNRMKSFINGVDDEDCIVDDEPIADLFPYTTVFFADIGGFTAWSSSRDPSQVFVLLETIYKAFDRAAKKRRVFKVETVGDCYVAGKTGQNQPRTVNLLTWTLPLLPFASHWTAKSGPKACFADGTLAWDCLKKFSQLSKMLEVALGPDTADLTLRIGLHSGPVTAGILRGERSRFQLFGDTVNTAARMESTSTGNRIQISDATANYLIADGKEEWLTRRDDNVLAKGKGVVETYWLRPRDNDAGSVASRPSGSHSSEGSDYDATLQKLDYEKNLATKRYRLEDWVVKLLLDHIREVVARHKAKGVQAENDVAKVVFEPSPGNTCLDEVKDVIELPKFDADAAAAQIDPKNVEISAVVVAQIKKLVGMLAATYHDNPFHNFEHACHVMMSVDKFLKRIANPDVDPDADGQENIASTLHDFAHGVTSDPLTVLAIVFSALIHDNDHPGVSNMQLCKENEKMAERYNSKSVAEQNSVDLSWETLMREDFVDLRALIFPNREELLRFRQIVVQVVLATDIFDKELNDLRKQRWKRAFSAESGMEFCVDTRATIVLEHIIQASDVSHTMQHWNIYRKWNARLFEEMYRAFKAGRMGKNPADFWYKGELGFFDNYIIPLALKLKDCNVFGVSSDECLNFAERNRTEWVQCGEAILAEMVEKLETSSAVHETIEDGVLERYEV